jgi:hypothetical protein
MLILDDLPGSFRYADDCSRKMHDNPPIVSAAQAGDPAAL